MHLSVSDVFFFCSGILYLAAIIAAIEARLFTTWGKRIILWVVSLALILAGGACLYGAFALA